MVSTFKTNELKRNIACNPILADICADMIITYIKKLPDNCCIGFYGCGNLAKVLLERHSGKLQHYQIFFIVTDPGEALEFKGFLLVSAATLKTIAFDHIIFLSHIFKTQFEREIPFTLRDKIHFLNEVIECEYKESHEKSVMTGISEYLLPHLNAITHLATGGQKMICIATHMPAHHLLKTIKQIRSLGFKTVLAVEHGRFTDCINLEQFRDDEIFDYCYESRYSYVLELIEITRQCPFSLIHAEAGMWSSEPLARIIEEKPCPVVVEYRDFKATVFRDHEQAMKTLGLGPDDFASELQAQETVFTQADAVVYKESPEVISYLAGKYGTCPGCSLHFMHYTDAGSIIRKKTEENVWQEPFRIVYAGNIVNAPNWHNYPIFSSLLNTARILDSLGIFFTIYNASDSTGKGFEEYLSLDEELPHFKYHFAVPYQSLKDKLCDYDFGWFCFDFSKARENPLFLKTTMGSKVFSYLESALPAIVSPEQEFIAKTVMDLGIGISLSYSQLNKIKDVLRVCDRRKMMENIHIAQESFSYGAQIYRLEKLYRKLINRTHLHHRIKSTN